MNEPMANGHDNNKIMKNEKKTEHHKIIAVSDVNKKVPFDKLKAMSIRTYVSRTPIPLNSIPYGHPI